MTMSVVSEPKTIPVPPPSFVPAAPSNSVQVSPPAGDSDDLESTVKETVRTTFHGVKQAFKRRQGNPSLPAVQVAYLARTKDGVEGGLFKVVDIHTVRGRHGTMTLKLHREINGKLYESLLDLRTDGPRLLTIDTVY